MSGTQKKYRILYSSYILSLTVLLCVLSLIIVGVTAHLIFSRNDGQPPSGNDWFAFWWILGLLLVMLVVLFAMRESTSWYTITEESITLHTLFRRPLTLRYEDVRHVGAGRNFLSVNYAYWLYLSCDPVPLEQLEDMRKFRLTRRGLRIAYSRKAFSALRDCLPPDLARQLERSRTSLRAWGVKDE